MSNPYPRTEEWKRKLSEKTKGIPKSEETKKKMEEAAKLRWEKPGRRELGRQHMSKMIEEGRVGWKKGNKLRKGKDPWNKGLTKENDERVKIYSENKSGDKNINWKGGNYICKECGKELANRKPKNKLCAKCFGKSISKEKHYNWKNGITPVNKAIRSSQQYITWRKKVFERDNYTCQKCKEVGEKLIGHHVEDFANNPELRFELKNGITLNYKCHRKFHSIYGKTHNTRKQLEEFLGQ